MNRFFYRLALFLAPLVLMLAAVEVKLSGFPNIYSRRSAALDRVADQVQILLVGNSHAGTGIDPRHLPTAAFSLAFPGQSTIVDARLASTMFRRLPRLRLLIVGIGYGSLRYRESSIGDYARDELFWQAFRLREDGNRFAGVLSPYRYLRFLAYRPFGPRAMLFGDSLRFAGMVSQEGWQVLDSTTRANMSWQAASAIAASQEAALHREDIADTMRELRAVLSQASQQRVRVVFVTPPLSFAYRAQLIDSIWDGDRSRIQALANRCGASFHDYAADPRFGARDFFDVEHLNARGAKKFTRLLADEIVRPALADRTGGTCS